MPVYRSGDVALATETHSCSLLQRAYVKERNNVIELQPATWISILKSLFLSKFVSAIRHTLMNKRLLSVIEVADDLFCRNVCRTWKRANACALPIHQTRVEKIATVGNAQRESA